MPFKSKSQARFLWAKHPKIAEEFAKKTPNMKALPVRKGLSEDLRKKKRG